MPLDTSIPLQIGRAPQVQALDPMTMYNAMQERQMNALRAQVLQQTMAQNALTMQNTMEDRRAAAAKAEQERAALARRRDIFSRFGTTDAAIGQRGVGYSGTGVDADPYAYVRNQLIKTGDLSAAEDIAKVQKEQLAGEESKAKIPGFKATSEENIVKARAAKIGQYGDAVLRASTPEEVYALIDSHADTLKELGFTADQAKKNFADLAARSGFDNAIMQSAKGAMATREHFDKMLTGQAGRTETITGADGTTYVLDKATGIAKPAIVGAPVGAVAGTPAPAGTPAVAETPATAGTPLKTAPKGQLTAAQKARLKAETSDDFTAATEALRYIQDIQRNVEGLEKTDIGGATGYQSLLPSFSKDTLTAEKDFKKLEGQLTALGRALASTSGKLGNLAVQEYEFLRQQVEAFDPYKGEEATREQLASINSSMRRLSNTVRDRYSRAYGNEDNPFPQFRELPEIVGEEPPDANKKPSNPIFNAADEILKRGR